MPEKTCGMKPEKPRVAVVVCSCGEDLSARIAIDDLVRGLKANPLVGLVRVGSRPCAKSEIDGIGAAVRKSGLSRVVLAGCNERLFRKFFRQAFAGLGLDPSLVEIVNIKEHAALVHRKSKRAATAKALTMVNTAVARMASARSVGKVETAVRPVCAVIGGGISGVSAAVALASRGIKVVLVEKQDHLGGILNHLNVIYPMYQTATEFVAEKERDVSTSGIEVVAGAEPVTVKGHVGDFSIELSNGRTVEAGTIIVAVGADLLDPKGIFGYGEVEHVVTQMALEDMLKRGERPGSNVVMIHCAGSRTSERPYCSRICCTASIVNTIVMKQKFPDTKITVLSRGFAEYAGDLDRARQLGVEIIRYSLERPPMVKPGVVEVYDEISEMETRVPFDLVVLAVPMIPASSNRALAAMLKIPTDEFGFLVEPHLKVRPEEFAPRGIFVAGCAHWPSTITESIVQAYGAASRAYDLMAAGKIVRDAAVATVDEDFCRGCGRCSDACEHGAVDLIKMDDGMKQAEIAAIQCTGCGVCVSVCPSGAITLAHFSPEEIDATVEAIKGA